jgi:acetyl esterase/lipase
MTVHRGLTYATPPGHRPLTLDLHLPTDPAGSAGSAGTAAVLCVYLHGGGWRAGSRRDPPTRAAPDFFARLTAAGLAVASVDYRLTAEATWPAPLDDVWAALTFLAERRAELGVATGRTVLWGASAGGHLAAMAVLADRALATAPAGPALPTIDAVVCWYPPTDLDALSKDIEDVGGHGDRSAGSREGGLVGGALDDRPELVADASPVNHARPGAPPFLFVHGAGDTAVPPRQSRRLADALTLHGGQATVELVAGAGHMFPELSRDAAGAVISRSVRFLLDPGQGRGGGPASVLPAR